MNPPAANIWRRYAARARPPAFEHRHRRSDHDNQSGLSTEVAVNEANGLTGSSVVSCDDITTIPADSLGEQIGVLLDRQEPALSEAIQAAFDLD